MQRMPTQGLATTTSGTRVMSAPVRARLCRVRACALLISQPTPHRRECDDMLAVVLDRAELIEEWLRSSSRCRRASVSMLRAERNCRVRFRVLETAVSIANQPVSNGC